MPALSRRAAAVLLALFLGAVFCSAVNVFKESDSFYHLAVGRLILETGQIPHTDPFSLSAAGTHWVTHEWLAEVVFFVVFQATGYWGVIVFVALLGVATYAMLLVLVSRLGGARAPSALILFLAGALTFELWIPRPQVFAYFLFALLLVALDEHRRSGHRRALVLAVLTIIAWANMHASVVLGLGVFALAYVVQWFLGRPKSDLGAAFGAAVLGALANPNGLSAFTYVVAIDSGVRALDVLEWRSILFFWNSLEAELVTLGIVLAGYAAWWRFGRGAERDIWWLGVVAASGILPFFAVRHIGFAVIPLGATLAVAGSELVRRAGSDLGRFIPPFAIACFVLVIAGRLIAWPVRFAHPATVPIGAADYVITSGARGPLFNFYGDGGYLLWRLYPPRRIFIDGRSEVFAGRPTEEYFAILDGTARGRELTDKSYAFGVAIIPYRDSLVLDPARRLFGRLLHEGWVPVFWDDASIVVVRSTTEHRELVARDAISLVSPFRDPTSIPENQARMAERELLHLGARVPESSVVADYLRRLRESHPVLRTAGS